MYKPLLEVEKKIGKGAYFITLKKDIRKEFEKRIEILEEKFFTNHEYLQKGFSFLGFLLKK